MLDVVENTSRGIKRNIFNQNLLGLNKLKKLGVCFS